MYNQYTGGMTTAGNRGPIERGGRKAVLGTLRTKKNVRKKPIFTNLKKKIRAHRAYTKVVRLFLNKNNINQIKPF